MVPKHLPLPVILLCWAVSFAAKAQQPPNPVLFADFLLGHSGGKAGGFTGGASLRYQKEKSLFTLRFTGTMRIHAKVASYFVPFPELDQRSSLEEIGLLYGRRFISDGRAWSFSLGVSHSTLQQTVNTSPVRQTQTTPALGLPFEAGIHWFKPRKERMRIYGLFPVGRPTGFGGSIGFRLTGNVSQNSFVGLALSFGLGFHRQYE